jgi:hypothetical protein
VQQNTDQPNQKLKHKTPRHNTGNKSRKPLAVVTIVLATALALIVGGYFGYKYYKNRQAVSPPPITDLENKPDIKREDTGVNLSKNNKTGTGEIITGDAQ